ncbi:hypothetical protein [Kibdelosporangium phytohabitans]|uniref:Uncharacterized protein n=1 Tax=Kibdelosporangium phytohabitans TaxID=860235 RepID=A0A0N9IAS8_9PSEU|nr:hypothetical protein [Kibdelosporangium phytohabitans]ALG11890.1 hypothetical protein AOZ06_37990 [Kibdelosporangium phytohabitans]MBE1463336.1 hypothetical protein [Kibdelosporangium phytohabitans]
MTTPLTSTNSPAPAHGPARYRTTAHGIQVVIPTRCPSGQHRLTTNTCRIYETESTLHVACLACAEAASTEHTWSLTTQGRAALSAEFDDQPYLDLLRPRQSS